MAKNSRRFSNAEYQASERGAHIVEWGAALLLVAAIVAVLVQTTSVPDQVSAGIKSAICTVAQGDDCDAGTEGSSQAGEPGGEAQPPARPPVQPPGQAQLPGNNPEGEPGVTTLPTPGQAQDDDGGDDREPSPSPGPPVPQPPPDPEKVDTEAALNETELGRDALNWAEENDVNVVYRPGGGSYFDGDSNTIVIDSSRSPEAQANTFVHEVNHARNNGEPDPEETERQEYIDAAIDEEVEGTVLGIQNSQQQQENDSSIPDYTLQQEYEDAYDNAVNQASKARSDQGGPPLTAEERERIGERAGRERVEQAFVNGEVVGSNSGQTYPENYGDAWDDANSCFLWVFC
jgi:hypothetical protein